MQSNEKNLDLLLSRIAGYYYNDNLSQNEIAKIENVSRSQISRLLIMARERGIVEIKIHVPQMDDKKMEKELRKKLGLKKVYICPSSASNKADSEQNFTTYAANLMPELLEKSKTVGLGWGRTIYNISSKLPILNDQGEKLFLPLLGNSGTRNPYLQTSNLVSRFAERFFADAFYLNFACIYRKGSFPREYVDQTLGQLDTYWNKLDAAIYGVGPRPEGESIYISEVEAIGISTENLGYQSASGELLGHLFNANGFIDPNTLLMNDQYNFLGISAEQLLKVPKTICVAIGDEKVVPLIDAATNKLYNTLITDHATADAILQNE